MLEQAGETTSFGDFFMFGAPITVGSLVIANIYILFCVLGGWW
jgi:Na+/H+ antiporter NhaD/arsenite permease-like protein